MLTLELHLILLLKSLWEKNWMDLWICCFRYAVWSKLKYFRKIEEILLHFLNWTGHYLLYKIDKWMEVKAKCSSSMIYSYSPTLCFWCMHKTWIVSADILVGLLFSALEADWHTLKLLARPYWQTGQAGSIPNIIYCFGEAYRFKITRN